MTGTGDDWELRREDTGAVLWRVIIPPTGPWVSPTGLPEVRDGLVRWWLNGEPYSDAFSYRLGGCGPPPSEAGTSL